MTTSKGGRPHKGPRVRRNVRFPEDLDAKLVQASQDAGYKYVQDYIVDVCAQVHRHPQQNGGVMLA